jgi:uncharacterized repeat protein (TIGR01451 family)
LDVTETWIYKHTIQIGAHDDNEEDPIINTVDVTGEDLDGDAVTPDSDTESVNILHRAGTLTIVKSANVTAAYHGDYVEYTFTITYSSPDGSPAVNVVVDDDHFGVLSLDSGDTDNDGRLDVTETWIYKHTIQIGAHDDNEEDPIINTVDVTGEDLDGDAVTPDSDTETVNILHRAGTLTIVKSANVTAAYHGDYVEYTFTVTYSSPDGSPGGG